MQDMNLEYKIIGKGNNVLVIETGIGGSFYDGYPFDIYRLSFEKHDLVGVERVWKG